MGIRPGWQDRFRLHCNRLSTIISYEGVSCMNLKKMTGLLLFSLAVILPPLLVYAQMPGSAERGKRYYDGHCASCHGLSGDGSGPEGVGLSPRPTNFKDATVMSGLTDNDLERTIMIGKENTAMRGYSTVLQPQDVEDLIAYIRTLSQQSK